MEKTLYAEYIAKYFRPVVAVVTEKYNDKSAEQPFLHKTMLREEYSANLSWGATELNHSIVAADVVALESPLPLKRRSSIAVATGILPKLGIKMRKGEKLINDINVMKASGESETLVAQKIFDDTAKVIKAMDVRKEIMFLQALSTGQMLVSEEDNNGTGVRADFGYREENTFKAVAAAWGSTGYAPLDDLAQLFDKALEDSNTIGHVWLSKKYFNLLRASDQGKLLAAAYSGQVITQKALLPTPSRSVMLEALRTEYRATFHVIDGAYKIESPDGTQKAVSPWAEANIVATPTDRVGRLVYGKIIEESFPIPVVAYAKSGSHVLVSKYSEADPREEITRTQMRCIPVIDEAENIYILTADEAATPA